MAAQEVSVYPQAKPMPEAELAPFLAQPLIAKLCTHNPDGSIHIAPLWFNYVDGEILMGTQEITQKVSNIKRDNQVTLLIDASAPVLRGVVIYGTAQLDYSDVIAKRSGIFAKYMGPEEAPKRAANLAQSWTPVVIRVKPERMITYDYSQGVGIPRPT